MMHGGFGTCVTCGSGVDVVVAAADTFIGGVADAGDVGADTLLLAWVTFVSLVLTRC